MELIFLSSTFTRAGATRPMHPSMKRVSSYARFPHVPKVKDCRIEVERHAPIKGKDVWTHRLIILYYLSKLVEPVKSFPR